MEREQDQYIEPTVAWIKHVMAQEQRPVLVTCESMKGCNAVGELLSEVGCVSVVVGYMNQDTIEQWLREHEIGGMPTIVVGTYQRLGYGVAFDWPTAYVTSACSLRIEEQIQLMARPRLALRTNKLLAYFPHSRPSNGWLTVADYVDFTIGGNLKQFGFDAMLDKTFSHNPKRD